MMLACSREKREARSIRVEYKAQAHAGDVLVPLRFSEEDREVIVLQSPEGRIYTIMELCF